MYKSNNNSGFTCLAPEDLVVCGRARITRVAESVNKMHSLVIYPAGNRGEANPRSDRSGHRLWTTAGGACPVLSLPGGALPPAGTVCTPAPQCTHSTPCMLGFSLFVLKTGIWIPSNSNFQTPNVKHPKP